MERSTMEVVWNRHKVTLSYLAIMVTLNTICLLVLVLRPGGING